jgi:peroxiredoxin
MQKRTINIILFVLCAGIFSFSPGVPYNRQWIGEKLPYFSFNDLNGRKIQTSDYKNKPMVINIWGTSCMACVKEIPDLNKLKEQNKATDIAFLAFTRNPKEKVLDLISRTPLYFRIVTNAKSFTDTLTTELPLTLFVNRAGIIVEAIDNIITAPRYQDRIHNAMKRIQEENK